MLYRTPKLTATLARELKTLDDLRSRLGAGSGQAGPWLGSLRRQWRASAAESSIEIEGYSVPAGEVAAVVSGRRVPDAGDADRMALACYARAMDHVGVMADDPGFAWNDRVILDLHFDACWFQKDGGPGRYRQAGIEVTAPGGGPAAFVGPPHEEVPGVMQEVVGWLESGNRRAHIVVRAAMAHLHVVSVHPFRDGNGRVSRIVQSLVLARDGVLAPEFLSIEDYLGAHTRAYYDVLREVQGGRYQPRRDATPWVRFCIRAHIEQAERRLGQLAQAGARWAYLEDLVEGRGWPDRLVSALEQSLFDGVDRASYAAEVGVSAPTASGDLRRLADAGLVSSRGGGRATHYVASAELRREVGAVTR